MKFSITRRMFGVAALALMTQACLFSIDPDVDDPNNTTNNTPDLCLETMCQAGQVCDPATGVCGVVACNFTSEEDGYQSTCAPGLACQLNRMGQGYCAPPCGSNSDCLPGVACAQKYSEVVGGGLCVTYTDQVRCDAQLYKGLCLSSEFCDEFDGRCYEEYVGPTCFARPDELSPGDECEVVLCEYDTPDGDFACISDSGGGEPGVLGVCHYNPDPDGFDPFFTGYCDDPCGPSSPCIAPGAECDEDTGRCVPSEGGPGCPPGLMYDEGGEECKPFLCDVPDTDEGDNECATESGLDYLLCGDNPFSNGSPGVCFPSCIEEECPSNTAFSFDLICDEDTGRCVIADGKECPISCELGDTCYEGGVCERATLNTLCSDDLNCSGDEECNRGGGVNRKRCLVGCTDDGGCPVGSYCVQGGGGDVAACVVACEVGDHCPEGDVCGEVQGIDGSSRKACRPGVPI